jgi:hypothetical protein
MTLKEPFRAIPESMDREIVAQIGERLDHVRDAEGVEIPLAIESGSRAWGFPSPDSDYDCRFIFVRKQRDYLSLWHKPDVIETPLDKVFDVNGWDLAKAIRLLLKGNAVVIEWLTSPISYTTDLEFRDAFVAVARAVADRSLIAKHYLHLGERQRHAYFQDGKAIPRKKIFYALRPAAALRWLRHHPAEAVAPMHFPTLIAECAPPEPVENIVRELIARKAQTRELGSEPLPSPIGAFIDGEFRLAHEAFGDVGRAPSADAYQICDAFFTAALHRWGN